MTASIQEWTEHFGLGDKAVLTLNEAALILRVCERSVREGVKNGSIPHLRLGRRILVPVPRLLEMLANMQQVEGNDASGNS